ncbi:MAG: chemotaxis protein CheW [Archangiaceae bacterium]|nr:chemotaxis protein CheW [Archangiaceae bacterium]
MTALHVVFKVGDVEYVLPASEVVELESFTQATRIPGAPPYVAGLVQIRGKVIAVVDLRARFGLPAVDRTLDSRVIVVRHQDRLVGLLADSARDVVKISPDEFRRPPEVVTEETDGFVDSIAQPGKRLVMKVDFAKVIGRQELPTAPKGAP